MKLYWITKENEPINFILRSVLIKKETEKNYILDGYGPNNYKRHPKNMYWLPVFKTEKEAIDGFLKDREKSLSIYKSKVVWEKQIINKLKIWSTKKLSEA